MYIALLVYWLDICISLEYVRECVWKCGVLIVLHEFAYIEHVYILNI